MHKLVFVSVWEGIWSSPDLFLLMSLSWFYLLHKEIIRLLSSRGPGLVHVSSGMVCYVYVLTSCVRKCVAINCLDAIKKNVD